MRLAKHACSICLILAVSGCSYVSNDVELTPKKPEVHKVSSRQVAPEPVYNRVRYVYLPDTTPGALAKDSGGTLLNPVAKLSLKNKTLEQAGIALAAIGNYQAYTASTIAKKRVTLEAYGTVDEIATQLAAKSGAHIVVDHPHREIRILKQSFASDSEIEPRFATEKDVSEEDDGIVVFGGPK